MSETETQPKLEVSLGSSETSKYLLRSKSEVISVLRTFVQKGAMISVHFNHGNDFFLTSVLAIDTDKGLVSFDVSGDSGLNRRAAQADKLILTTFIDKVKIQFSLDRLSESKFEGRVAFVSKFPEAVLRLQRREYFRLTIPVATPVNCSLFVRREDGSMMQMDVPLWDISGGGLGIIATPEQMNYLSQGQALKDCKIVLPEEGTLIISLCVRNMFEVTGRSGAKLTRVGCEFVDVPMARLNLVQRYITRIERERKARLSGLG